MDIDSLQKSTILLQKYQESQLLIKSLQKELESKQTYILSLESQIKALTSNTQQQTYISSLESKLQTLQQKFEALQIVNSTQQKAEESIPLPSNQKSEKFFTDTNAKLDQLLSSPEIWSSLRGFLTEPELLKLVLLSDSAKHSLSQDPVINPSAPDVENSQPEPEAVKTKEIHGLLKQEHYFELNIKGIEEKLVHIMKTLLVMQKTTDILTSVSLPTEKYSSIEELVIARFTTEKTVQLIQRSASYLAGNPSKMAEWVNFVDGGFAGLLFESSKLLNDAKTLERIKNDLISKLKVSEELLVALEFERNEISEQLDTEKTLKIHLAKRLKKQDADNYKKTAELSNLKECVQQSEMEKIHLSKKLERLSSEFDEHRKLMANEIFRLRKQINVSCTQKKEYLEAFEEFQQILNSLPFE